MSESFNASLDFAVDVGADLLFHTASDVIAYPHALHDLLRAMDPDRHYLSVGRGYDIINGDAISVGLWVFNMRILGNRFRFRDVYKQDLDLCSRIEQATSTERTYSGYENSLGYHHPIWTPREMFMKFRYGTQKYSPSAWNRFERFFDEELSFNPMNKTLLAGLRGYEGAREVAHDWGSKDPQVMQAAFESLARDLHLTGREFYVRHLRFKRIAQILYRSFEDCVTIEERETEGERDGPADHDVDAGGAADLAESLN
jgi:hypothetical protein